MIIMTLSQHTDGTNVAETFWHGPSYRAKTHGGATHELARQLVRAGAEDQPWQAVRGPMICLSGKSLPRWAELKTEDNDTCLRVVKWRPLQWQKAPTQRGDVSAPAAS